MTFACIFPGQGAQKLGMLHELGEVYPEVKETFQEASEIAGRDLWLLAQEGPAEELNRTQNAQLTLLASELAIWRLYSQQGPTPAYVAGHSFGEYSALVVAGSLDFSSAVHLVSRRGELMQQVASSHEGGMAAILKLQADQVLDICREVSAQALVEVVNFNAPGQVVLSGLKGAVEQACEACSQAGGRAIVLDVKVPAHSSLMREVDEEYSQALEATEFRVPSIPLINNVDVAIETEPDRIRDALRRQLFSPVRWADGILKIVAQGVENFIEIGPGKVLSGLNRRIDRSAQSQCIEDPASLEKVWEELG